MRKKISFRNLCKIGAIVVALAGYVSATHVGAQVGSSCTPATRGITTFSCGAPSDFVCGASPNFACPAGAPAVLGANQAYNCDTATCEVQCTSGRADCDRNTANGCEATPASGSCTTAGGQAGTWGGPDCARVCSANPRPNIILAPGSAQADDQANSSVWINKTGSGHLFQLQGGGTDRVVVTNSGQFVLGLSATDWTTFTQTIGAGQTLIYGGLASASAGNAFLFERQGTPNLTLLRLTANGQLQLPNLAADPIPPLPGALYFNIGSSAVRLYNGTLWSTLGGGLRLITESDSTVTVAGNITATGCFGPIFAGVTSAPENAVAPYSTTGVIRGVITGRGEVAPVGYRGGHDRCVRAFTGSHMCSTQEILNSVSCGTSAGTSAVFQALPPAVGGGPGRAWIANGAPALPTQTNDCNGWTYGDASATVNGVAWAFDVNGGVGWAQTCNSLYPIACCR